MHFQEFVHQKGGHTAVLSVWLSRIRLSQATNKNRIYTSDCLKSILFFVRHKIQRGELHMGNGKAIAKNRFSSGTGNRQLYLRIFCFLYNSIIHTAQKTCVLCFSVFVLFLA